MKFFRTEQIKQIDSATIEHEPIASIDLMERAASALTGAIIKDHGGRGCCFAIFAGSGNNGGDALAVARMLATQNEQCAVWLISPNGKLSPDCKENLEQLKNTSISINICNDRFTPPSLPENSIIIDGLFGSGLSRPVEGIFADAIKFINSSGAKVVAIDIPSGLYGEKNDHHDERAIVKADTTLTLQFPKLALLLPENEKYAGEWRMLDIGLSLKAIEETESPYHYTALEDIKPLIHPRGKFSHKGDYGRALLIAGSQGMAGASILAARAALRSGTGLLTVAVPMCNNAIVQTAVPEAMTLPNHGDTHLCTPPDVAPYNAIGIGPGLGTKSKTAEALSSILDNCKAPMVLDADALNILAANPDLMTKIPRGSIITPHPGEFARLVGRSINRYEEIEKAVAFAKEQKICVVLKGAYTAVCSEEGECYFNSTGNPGMAGGGSGDVLTGIILALSARGYGATDAARIAVYLHGLAGDIAAERLGQTAMTAGDIIDALPSAWKYIEEHF